MASEPCIPLAGLPLKFRGYPDDNDANSQAEWARGMRRDMGDSFGREIDEMIQQADPSAMGGDDSGGGFVF